MNIDRFILTELLNNLNVLMQETVVDVEAPDEERTMEGLEQGINEKLLDEEALDEEAGIVMIKLKKLMMREFWRKKRLMKKVIMGREAKANTAQHNFSQHSQNSQHRQLQKINFNTGHIPRLIHRGTPEIANQGPAHSRL